MLDNDVSPAIAFRQIEQKRPNFKLGPINLDIPRGYITAIVGPNGSGKSSLFRVALELTRPDKGSVTILDHVTGERDDHIAKQQIGYMAEESSSHEDGIRASDKASFNGFWYSNWDVNRYQELLHLLQVNDNYVLGKMSKGMRRKFEFALALAHGPELLLLDEPSSGLDPLAWKIMIDVLHRYMDKGNATILMTSHIIEEVKRLADFIVFMAQGRILGVYEKDELFSNWFAIFISGDELTASQAAMMPGQCEVEHVGGSTFRVTTSSMAEAERWCLTKGYLVISKQALELDEIMSALLQQDGLGTRVNEARGVLK